MSKFAINYSGLDDKIYKKAYRLSDVKDRLETVSWDIVRFKDGDKAAELWQVRSADDGDYIVSLYQEDAEKTASPWGVQINKLAGTVQISYRGDPLVKISSSKLGIPREELDRVSSYLPEKLAGNPKLTQALLNELPVENRRAVLSKYPELKVQK